MNAERLHIIAIAVRDDLSETNVETTLQNLVSSLNNQVNQPAQPQFQQEVSNHLQTLKEALTNAASNKFRASWRQVLEEFGVEDLLGENLRKSVEEIFERKRN